MVLCVWNFWHMFLDVTITSDMVWVWYAVLFGLEQMFSIRPLHNNIVDKSVIMNVCCLVSSPNDSSKDASGFTYNICIRNTDRDQLSLYYDKLSLVKHKRRNITIISHVITTLAVDKKIWHSLHNKFNSIFDIKTKWIALFANELKCANNTKYDFFFGQIFCVNKIVHTKAHNYLWKYINLITWHFAITFYFFKSINKTHTNKQYKIKIPR